MTEQADTEAERVQLRESVTLLAARVTRMATALEVVNRIQQRQQDLDEKGQLLAREAADAKARADRAETKADNLEAVVVPREEHERREREAAEERALRRRRNLRRAIMAGILTAIVLGVISGLIWWGLARNSRSDKLLTDVKTAAYKSCLVRNDQQGRQRDLYRSLIAAEQRRPRPDGAVIDAYTTVLRGIAPDFDCRIFLSYQPGQLSGAMHR